MSKVPPKKQSKVSVGKQPKAPTKTPPKAPTRTPPKTSAKTQPTAPTKTQPTAPTKTPKTSTRTPPKAPTRTRIPLVRALNEQEEGGEDSGNEPLPLTPTPTPAINSPFSGSTVPGGAGLTLTVSTNRTDVTHFVQLLDEDGLPIGAPVTVDFSTGSPATVVVSIPAATSTDTGYTIRIFTTAPAGDAGSIAVTVVAI